MIKILTVLTLALIPVAIVVTVTSLTISNMEPAGSYAHGQVDGYCLTLIGKDIKPNCADLGIKFGNDK